MISIHDATAVLFLVGLLQFKHFICDGPLQTKTMVDSKSKYGSAWGIVHALLHGLGTALVLSFWPYSWAAVLAMAVLDFAIHYHVDYSKENLVKSGGWTTADAPFWWALSADQWLHQLTYLIIVSLLIKGA